MSDCRPEDVEAQDRIPDDDIVIRGVAARHLIDIENSGGKKRVTKAAFSPSSERDDPERGMSVNLQSKLVEHGLDPQNPLYEPGFEVLMSFRVGDLRELGLEVVRRPLPENPSHCNVLGIKGTARKKELLRLASFVRRPARVFKSAADANRKIDEVEN